MALDHSGKDWSLPNYALTFNTLNLKCQNPAKYPQKPRTPCSTLRRTGHLRSLAVHAKP